MVRIAEAHGWPTPNAFFAAMVLHTRGVTPEQALFADAERRKQ